MDRAFVSMAQHQCVVCLKLFDTGEILLDRRLKPSMEQHTTTGRGLCPEHQKLKNDGFVALIELQREPLTDEDPLSAPRTGMVAHIRSSAWPFNVPVPAGSVAVAQDGTIAHLQAMTDASAPPNIP